MIQKFILLVMLATSFLTEATPSAAYIDLKWSVGIDVPVRYTTKITTGQNGVIIEGFQTNVSKKRAISYELVKRGFWTDQTIDKVLVKNEGEFKIHLNAPQGDDYFIKISGNGNMASGNLTIIPFE